MNDRQQSLSWTEAFQQAAAERNIQLPPCTSPRMGNPIWRNQGGDRFVSMKRRFVSANEAATNGIEWTLWTEEDDRPLPVAAFRESVNPRPDRVEFLLTVLNGWLFEQWTSEKLKQLGAQEIDVQV
jgi:hypothetical protein